ncbi:glycine--tRNA ligase [Candidatus Gracilibacteria bacterium]|nr:glycine--tRNA ligase [Candidatus Gracilibacteria bacterium]
MKKNILDKEKMQKIVSFCKRKGIIFPASEIYGGFANTYTYGPYGVEIKNNIKNFWWKNFVQARRDIVGIDSPILLNPKTWEASGHATGFNDALTDCRDCKSRFRADHLIENQLEGVDPEGLPFEEMTKIIHKNSLKCEKCGSENLTDVRKFSGMFEMEMGKIGESEKIFLRPETAQGIFLEFKNVLDNTRQNFPFGIAQIGKSFRNEITPGNFTFRLLEFEQMEIEYFIEEKNWEEIFEKWQNDMKNFCKNIGLSEKNFRFFEHSKEKLSHYSKRTVDIEYNFPFGGFKELTGLAYRTDFDLSQHDKFSGQELKFRNSQTNEKFIPHVIEPSFGLDRAVLAVICEAYFEKEDGSVIFKLDPKIAPVKCAILPLIKKFTPKAEEIFDMLKMDFACELDEKGSIGRRYARQDEIGTPFCVTVDFDTLGEGDEPNDAYFGTVTVRNRDNGEQVRIKIKDLKGFLVDKIK